jgi:hypothetical protein
VIALRGSVVSGGRVCDGVSDHGFMCVWRCQYSSDGYYTCQHYPASLDYETADADSFASWGVDYLKWVTRLEGGLVGCAGAGELGDTTSSFPGSDVLLTSSRSPHPDLLQSTDRLGSQP